jgi:hypothetical protein
MIIFSKRLFSQQEEPIDISHLSPEAQKEIISRERRKIELDQKISDTAHSLSKSRKRASMSIEDNARLGAYEISKNPMAGVGTSLGGSVLGVKVGEWASKAAGVLGAGDGVQNALKLGGFGTSRYLTPLITDTAGRISGAIKGMTAGISAKRNERKLKRLTKKRASLEE